MEKFIKEIDERITELQLNPTDVNIGKISELVLVKIRLNTLRQDKQLVCKKCEIPFEYDWHVEYNKCPKCGSDHPILKSVKQERKIPNVPKEDRVRFNDELKKDIEYLKKRGLGDKLTGDW